MSGVIRKKTGGLNESMQHLLNVFLWEFTRPISFAGVRSKEPKACLCSDRVPPYRSILEGKYCQINLLEGVATTG